MDFVRPLASLSRADIAVAGGKAANLGELINAGLPVPEGFCVTTNAFDEALELTGLQEHAETLVEQAGDEAESMEHVSARLREAVGNISIPGGITSEIAQAVTALGGAVAVRSSATMEDTPEASFAGQYDSYLNVVSADGVIEKVRECWASLWSPRALRYRRERGLRGSGKMGVMVQRMVDPTASGVAFTADVVRGKSDQMTISAAFGLGEALVSGSVTPDVYIIDRATRGILHRFSAYKERHTVASRQGGIVQEELPEARRQALSLTDPQVGEVVALALAAEALLGAPQDVEWAMDGERVYLVQARPLVKVPGAEAHVTWESPVDDARWRRSWRLGEWLSDPVTPLFATSLLPVLVAGREKQGLGHLGWQQSPSFTMPEPWYCIVNGYFYTRQDPPNRAGRSDSAARARGLQDRMPWLDNWRKVHFPAYLERLEAMKRLDVRSASYSAILDHLNDLYGDAGEFWYLLAPIGFGFEEFYFSPVYDRLLPPQGSRPHPTTLFSGYVGKTLQSQIELESIAAEVAGHEAVAALFRALPPEQVPSSLEAVPGGAPVKGRLKRYLEEYGCQVYSLDFFFPTLGEQPEVTITNIRNYLLAPVKPVADRVASQVRERERATLWVLDHVAGNAEDLETIKGLLGWHQACAEVREDAIFYFQAGWPLMRRALAELGGRLRQEGVLEMAEDIYFLEQGGLEAIARGLEEGHRPPKVIAEPVDHRKKEWQARRRLSPPDMIPPAEDPIWESSIFSRMPTGHATDDAGRSVLRGQAASPGRSRGRARLILSPDEFGRMRPGDILVTVATNPAWTSLFPLASAVVTETGGGATHCSLVAREYQIPAVMGTGSATQVIRDGQIITVDGTRGIVLLED